MTEYEGHIVPTDHRGARGHCYTQPVELAVFREVYTPLIQTELGRQLQPVAVAELKAAMAHLTGRGKLFRPILALATCRAVTGADPLGYLALATPLELIHTFTLIHDDLPCMDDADLRRGVPAVHLAYDEALAVLAGDALLNYAIKLLAEVPSELTDTARLRMILAATEATHAVVEGQVLDLQGEGRRLTLLEMQRMHGLKTGALIGACCETGAILAGLDHAAAAALHRFGAKLGLAFQIRDDLLSVESSEAAMGKTLTTDEDKEKSTYPRLLGLDAAHRELDQTLDDLQSQLSGLGLVEPQLLGGFIDWAGRRNH